MKEVSVQQHAIDRTAVCLSMICLFYKKVETIAKLRDLMETELSGANPKRASQIGQSKHAVESALISNEAKANKVSFMSYINVFM